MLKFTILTPTLLRDTFVKTCESIQNQNYSNWEHLVAVDDPSADLNGFLDSNPHLRHPNRKIFVCDVNHHNVGNTCRSNMFKHISPDTDYVLYLDDDNYYIDEAFSWLNSSLSVRKPSWGTFPMHYKGGRFLDSKPRRNHVDTNQIYHKPYIGGQPIKYMPLDEYCADGKMAEWLTTLDSPCVLNDLPELSRMDVRGYGAPILAGEGKDPYTVVTPTKYDSVIQPYLASIRKFRSKPLRMILITHGHDRNYGYDHIRYDRNKFVFTHAANMGIAASGNDDVILVNDDIRLTQMGTFQKLFEIAYSDSAIGILSPVVDGGVGNVYMDSNRVDQLWGGKDRIYPAGTGYDYISFACVYLKRQMLNQIGFMDEGFTGYGRDDADMCIRAVKAGWKLAITKKVKVIHGAGGAQYSRGKNWSVTYWKQRIGDSKQTHEYFYKKYPNEPRNPKWPQPHAVPPANLGLPKVYIYKSVFLLAVLSDILSNWCIA